MSRGKKTTDMRFWPWSIHKITFNSEKWKHMKTRVSSECGFLSFCLGNISGDLETQCVDVSSKSLHMCACTHCTHSHKPAQMSTWQALISDRKHQTGYIAVCDMLTSGMHVQEADMIFAFCWNGKWSDFFFSCPEKLNFMEGFSPLGSCVQSITSSMSSCQNYYQGFRVLLLALKFSINTNIMITFHLNSTSTSVRAATSAKQTQRSMSIVQELHNCYRNLHELLLKIKKHRDLFSLCVLYWLERSWDFTKL